MTFILHAFNARGEQLKRWQSNVANRYYYGSTFASADDYDTILWAAGPGGGYKSGERYQEAKYAHATGAAGTWKRNRIAYFHLLADSIVIARIEREEDGSRQTGDVRPVVDNDLSGDGRYSVTREGTGAPAAQYVARFTGTFISAHNDVRDAYAACRRHRAEQFTGVFGVTGNPIATKAQLTERADRGAAWLDEHFPGWQAVIEGSDGYSVAQLAHIAGAKDSDGGPAALSWVRSVAEAKERVENRFGPNPYWGNLDSVFAIVVEHANYNTRVGLAIYADDNNGRASGHQIDFVDPVTFDGRNLYDYLEDAGYGVGTQDVTIVNFRQRLVVTADEWTRMADASSWPASSEKFSDGLAERLFDADMISDADGTLGTSDGFGYYALFSDDHAIMTVNSQGFVGAAKYPNATETQNAWEGLERDFERFNMAGMEDALPTGSCDGIFLIFDTARHNSSVADRDEVEEHVRECDVCGDYRYVLDEY